MISNGAREASGLGKTLDLRSLIITRFITDFVAYFFLSVSRAPLHRSNSSFVLTVFLQLFYSLLSVAFQIDFSRKCVSPHTVHVDTAF